MLGVLLLLGLLLGLVVVTRVLSWEDVGRRGPGPGMTVDVGLVHAAVNSPSVVEKLVQPGAMWLLLCIEYRFVVRREDRVGRASSFISLTVSSAASVLDCRMFCYRSNS